MVLPRFLFYFVCITAWFFSPESCLKKLSSSQGAFDEQFSGTVFGVCVQSMLCGAVEPRFLHYFFGFVLPEVV